MDNSNPDNQFTNKPNIPETQPPSDPNRFGPAQPSTSQTQAPQPQQEQRPMARPDIPQVISNNQKPKRRWRKVLLTLLVIAILAVGGWFAYQKFYNKESDSTATVKRESKDIPSLSIGLEEVDYGNLYPDMGTNEYSFLVNAQIFEGLVRYENRSKIVPALATDWSNPDSKTWVFTINKNIKFHDGNTVTAKDVKYSLDKVIASKSDLADTFASTIASVEVIGPDKVKIATTDADPTLLNRLAFLYIIDDELPAGEEPSMAGTGPYYVKPGTKTSHTEVQLAAFDSYHGGKPKTRELSFGSEKSVDALIKAFDDGKYNIIGTVSPERAGTEKGAYKFVSVEPDVHFIAFNTVREGPLQKKKVREAIRYALDPLAIGRARDNEVTPLSQMIPESIPGYNPAIAPYEQNTEKARKLLKEAGYPDGVTLTFSTSDTDKSTNEFVSELKKAGINLKIDQHNDFDEFIDYFLSGKPEMYTVDYSSDTLDGLDIFRTTISDAYYKNPEFYQTLDKAGATIDPATRLKLLQDAALILDKDIPVVPLSTEDNLWLMDKDYKITQDMPSSYISVYFYKVQQK